jgi:hypothetical protein
MFGNLLGITLGASHLHAMAYSTFWDLLTKDMHNDLQTIMGTTGGIKPAHVLRSNVP